MKVVNPVELNQLQVPCVVIVLWTDYAISNLQRCTSLFISFLIIVQMSV
jgi:hypothetical protein